MNRDQLAREIQFTAVRSRGPGGQNVNKVNSAALIAWNFWASTALTPDEKHLARAKIATRLDTEGWITIRSDEYRDQPRNKDRAFEKLVELLEAALVRETPRRKTRPTRGSKERKLQSKARRSDVKRSRGKVKY